MEDDTVINQTIQELFKTYTPVLKETQNIWLSGFNDLNFDKKRKCLLNIWGDAEILQLVKKSLFERLVNAYKVETEYGMAIIYILTGETKSSVQVYIGWEPTTAQIPNLLSNFYKHVHNGFVELYSHAMGLLPQQEFERYDASDWEFKLSGDVSNQIIVFRDGSGGYISLDTKLCDGAILYTDAVPEEHIDFKKELDDWTLIGVTD